MTTQIVNNTSASAQARIERARMLQQQQSAAPKAAGEKSGELTEKQKLENELRKEMMPHPYKPGEVIKQCYAGEFFPRHGLTLMDWITVTFVEPREERIAKLEKEIADLKAGKKAPSLK